MNELIPCPFCGSDKIEIVDNGIGDYFCECQNCGAASDQRRCEDPIFAVERWNTRAEPAIVQKAREIMAESYRKSTRNSRAAHVIHGNRFAVLKELLTTCGYSVESE